MTESDNKLLKLAQAFSAEDLEWRIQQSGLKDSNPWAIVIPFVNARAVMNRLDEVVGPSSWKDRYWREGAAVMCGLSIKVDGEWVEKVDGSEETDIEAVKGGISGALKRAAVKWGIGRDLYNFEKCFANFKGVDGKTPGAIYAKIDGKAFHWVPPTLEITPQKPPATLPTPKPAAPLKAAPPVSDDSDIRNFKFEFGQFNGSVMGNISATDLREYMEFLEGPKTKKPLSTKAKEAVTAIKLYLETAKVS